MVSSSAFTVELSMVARLSRFWLLVANPATPAAAPSPPPESAIPADIAKPASWAPERTNTSAPFSPEILLLMVESSM